MADYSVCVDLAGGRKGGAARFLKELDCHVRESAGVQFIGRENRLTARWLLQRELEASAPRRISLNNASMVAGEERVVLLRNALHFASAQEMDQLNFSPSPELRAQTPVIRALARRATEIVVPCTAMAERVVSYLPRCADRITVKFHPVSQVARREVEGPRAILMPIVNSPYKQLEVHVAALLAANEKNSERIQIILTGTAQDYPKEISSDPSVRFIGVVSADVLNDYWATVDAIYFPTKLEAFGYPLAEARTHGVPVLALDTPQNREIAGNALRPFTFNHKGSIATALRDALDHPSAPDPAQFDPKSYFQWLMGAK